MNDIDRMSRAVDRRGNSDSTAMILLWVVYLTHYHLICLLISPFSWPSSFCVALHVYTFVPIWFLHVQSFFFMLMPPPPIPQSLFTHLFQKKRVSMSCMPRHRYLQDIIGKIHGHIANSSVSARTHTRFSFCADVM